MNGVPPHRRDVAMVFQNPALYPHLSVFGNLVFGVRGAGSFAAQARSRVNQRRRACWGWTACWAEAQRAFRRRAPAGGDRTGLVREPRIVLLDEPFSNLDATASRGPARRGDRASPPIQDDARPRHARPIGSAADGRSGRHSREGPASPVRLTAGDLRSARHTDSWPRSSAARR